nr:gamma-glutamyltransferase [Bradyrhizobium sp. 168]
MPQISKDSAAISAIFLPDGMPLKVGDRLRQPELAGTLRIIARDGGKDAAWRRTRSAVRRILFGQRGPFGGAPQRSNVARRNLANF